MNTQTSTRYWIYYPKVQIHGCRAVLTIDRQRNDRPTWYAVWVN